VQFSLNQLILALLSIVFVASTSVALINSLQYQESAKRSHVASIKKVMDISLQQASRKLKSTTKELGIQIQSSKKLKKSLKQYRKAKTTGNIELISEALNSYFIGMYYTSGLLDLIQIRFYDKSFQLIATSNLGPELNTQDLKTFIVKTNLD